jgi:hypothetical protein
MSKVNSPEDATSESNSNIELDPVFKNQLNNLYRLTVAVRWLTILLLWLTVGIYSLWELRYPISLIQEDFTWAAVKYGLIFQPIPGFGLCLCVMLTTTSLLWQSRNLIWGIPKKERQRLIKQVTRIRKQGSSHPLWKWVVESVES